MDAEDLVSVYKVNNPTEAELIRSALQSVGIDCTIGGESQAGLAGVLEIDVMVHAGDAKEARKYLNQLRHEKIERKKKRIEAKKARADHGEDVSEGIQEMRPPIDIQEPPISE